MLTQTIGHCLQDLDLWEQSVPVFTRSFVDFPGSKVEPACLYDAGLSLRELERFDEARVLWERVERGPTLYLCTAPSLFVCTSIHHPRKGTR